MNIRTFLTSFENGDMDFDSFFFYILLEADEFGIGKVISELPQHLVVRFKEEIQRMPNQNIDFYTAGTCVTVSGEKITAYKEYFRE